MSNKRYRRMAGTPTPIELPAQSNRPTPAASQDATAATPVPEAVNPVIDNVIRFLGKVMEKVAKALDDAEALPVEESQWDYGLAEAKQKLIMGLARIGISAARATIQALKQTGQDTKQAEEALKQTAQKLEERLAKQQKAMAQAA